MICVCNFSPVVRHGYIGSACLRLAIIAKSSIPIQSGFGGSNVGNSGGVEAEPVPRHGFDYSLSLTLPPLPCCGLGRLEYRCPIRRYLAIFFGN
ncbi:MAG: hypothetical protein JO071_01770 [Deltaproteobacteria bacterium]|nr:hypothetical protein [Deltaproteobacteria bacterium]